MRSLLFVPADSERKLARAFDAGADVVILDLEDSVAAGRKADARALAAEAAAGRPGVAVRVNPLASGLVEEDLAAVVSARPGFIVLPKAETGADVAHLSALLSVAEARADVADGATGIIAIATETAAALFGLGTYGGSTARLAGLTWGAEDLSTALGATRTRDAAGALTHPYALARSLCLAGARAAGVTPVDTVFTDFRNDAGLRAEAEAAAADGFEAKLAIHPAQVAPINEAFTPSAQALAEARRVVEAFRAEPGAGVVSLDGRMLDRPHLRNAQRLLDRAARLAGT
jgi:citrate lyase subunit beta/citryl-CoA lyase